MTGISWIADFYNCGRLNTCDKCFFLLLLIYFWLIQLLNESYSKEKWVPISPLFKVLENACHLVDTHNNNESDGC